MKNMFRLLALAMFALMLAACAAPAPAPAPAEEEAAPAEEEMAEEEMAEEDMAEEEMAEEEMAEESAATFGTPYEGYEGEYTIATVVKLTGVGWFDRMEEGVVAFGNDHPGVTAFQQGPAQADAAQQIQVIEDLIAQNVDAITVVPFQPDTVEPVLQRAREAGIVVVSHEASNQENVDADIEAFSNAAYGEMLMENLATCMGGEGEYVVFVGSLTSQTHNEWVDAGIAYQQANYPNMTLVGDKNESFDDAETARQKMQEVLAAFPNVRGLQGSSANDVVGAGLAVEEAGLQDETCLYGTSLPSMAGDLLESGAVDMIAFWDPALAGYAMNKLALMFLSGETPESGMDLGIPGYEEITSEDGKVFYGSAWVTVTSENLADWDF